MAGPGDLKTKSCMMDLPVFVSGAVSLTGTHSCRDACEYAHDNFITGTLYPDFFLTSGY